MEGQRRGVGERARAAAAKWDRAKWDRESCTVDAGLLGNRGELMSRTVHLGGGLQAIASSAQLDRELPPLSSAPGGRLAAKR